MGIAFATEAAREEVRQRLQVLKAKNRLCPWDSVPWACSPHAGCWQAAPEFQARQPARHRGLGNCWSKDSAPP